MKLNKKGFIENLNGVVTSLVAVGLVLVIGLLIMAEVQDQAITLDGATSLGDCNSSACNGTSATIGAIADIPTWLPIIVITIIGSLLLGLVALFRRGR